MSGPTLAVPPKPAVDPALQAGLTTTSQSTGVLSSLNMGTGTTFGVAPVLGLGMGTGLGSLLLPGNFSPSMKSIFAAAVALPIISALASPNWSRNIFYSGAGIAAGIYAGILLSQNNQSQST